jgi:hypothetical protein
MANDWSGVDKPEYIPDTETDAGDYIRMDMEQTKKIIKKAKEMLSNEREAGD